MSEALHPASSARGGDAGPALVVRNLLKRFGDVTAVADVSLRVPAGCFLSLLGPSGSGKTTVLRLLGGFESPDQGSIEIDGQDIAGLPPWRREMGIVFQHYALFPQLNVRDNVAFPLKQRKVPRAPRAERVDEMLEVMGLRDVGDRLPAELSGGEQQRVALARALVFKPRMLLMDEPLAALDKRLRQGMQQEIRSLQRRFGITTLYVTHDQTEAFALSDLVAVMNAGRIEQVGTPRSLYDAPRTGFVAQFVGDSNLFRGEAANVDGEPAIRLPNGVLLRYASFRESAAQVTLLVRPERIAIDGSSAVSRRTNVLRGRIADAMFLGETIVYRVHAAGQDVLVREPHQPGSKQREPGTDVQLSWTVSDTVALQ